MLTVMQLSRTISLLAHVSRFVTVTFAAGMALAPALRSQTAKELIGDACHNELQQRERRTLWSYVAERRSNNPVFREQVIETVDAPVRHLLAVDGQPPTSGQIKEENDRHQRLLNDAFRRQAIRKQQDDEDKKMEELFRVIPGAFVFEDQGKEGQSERIAFHPNPGFKPKTYVASSWCLLIVFSITSMSIFSALVFHRWWVKRQPVLAMEPVLVCSSSAFDGQANCCASWTRPRADFAPPMPYSSRR
jgi:hypothetical protein